MRFILTLLLCHITVMAQDSLGADTPLAEEIDSMTVSVVEVDKNRSAKYNITLHMRSGEKYKKVRLVKMEGNILTVEKGPFYLPSQFTVNADNLHSIRVRTGVAEFLGAGGAALGCWLGVGIGANLSIAIFDTYEHLEFWIGGGLLGTYALSKLAMDLASLKYDLGLMNTQEQRELFTRLILDQ